MEHAPARTPERQAFYDRIAPGNLAPLWESLHSMVTAGPQPKALPTLWRYRDVRPFLIQSGSLISAQEATRRVLMLMNPGLGGQASITGSLFAGLQLIMPGEIAPAHRHTQSALRFVIEGRGAYTAVDGERTTMEPGDFIITPSWTWHDHGNDTQEPVVWLDYPYTRTREALDALARNGAPDPYHGHKLRYVNPASGESAMPTIATFVQLLPASFASLPYRATDGTVFVCVEGEGETRVGDTVLPWQKNDIFVVPSWASHTHHAAAEAVLFSFSDRVVQEKLGLWREARGNA
jgi:gentisate 1,2-dioxygenase